MPVVKGHSTRDSLPHTFNIGVFEYGKNNYTKIKRIYKGSDNWIGSFYVAFNSISYIFTPWILVLSTKTSIVLEAGATLIVTSSGAP